MSKRFLIIGLTISFIISIICVCIINYYVHQSLNGLRNSYAIPDTTVTYSGGKYDTLIVQKSVPSWLK